MRVAVAIVGAACVTVAWACGGFGEADDEPPPFEDSGAPDGSSSGDDATTDANAADADAGEADAKSDATSAIGTHLPACPRPPGPTCAPANCDVITLYEPQTAEVEYPFGIITDSNYVYWTAMTAGGGFTDPYNGEGASKIMRVDRSGAVNGAKASVLVSNQVRAVALAIGGDFLYWVALDVSGVSQLRRVRRDCAASCVPEELGPLGTGPTFRLLAMSDDTLVAVHQNNTVRMIKIGTSVAQAGVVANANLGAFTSVAVSPTAAVITGGVDSNQVRQVLAGAVTSTQIGSVPDAAADSGLSMGLAPITTDCKSVYGVRGRAPVWRLPFDGGTAAFFSSTANMLPFDLAADQSDVWIGAANGDGLWAVEISTGLATQVVQNVNIHRIAVDDVGVYWGEHESGAAGALFMLKKK